MHFSELKTINYKSKICIKFSLIYIEFLDSIDIQ